MGDGELFATVLTDTGLPLERQTRIGSQFGELPAAAQAPLARAADRDRHTSLNYKLRIVGLRWLSHSITAFENYLSIHRRFFTADNIGLHTVIMSALLLHDSPEDRRLALLELYPPANKITTRDDQIRLATSDWVSYFEPVINAAIYKSISHLPLEAIIHRFFDLLSPDKYTRAELKHSYALGLHNITAYNSSNTVEAVSSLIAQNAKPFDIGSNDDTLIWHSKNTQQATSLQTLERLLEETKKLPVDEQKALLRELHAGFRQYRQLEDEGKSLSMTARSMQVYKSALITHFLMQRRVAEDHNQRFDDPIKDELFASRRRSHQYIVEKTRETARQHALILALLDGRIRNGLAKFREHDEKTREYVHTPSAWVLHARPGKGEYGAYGATIRRQNNVERRYSPQTIQRYTEKPLLQLQDTILHMNFSAAMLEGLDQAEAGEIDLKDVPHIKDGIYRSLTRLERRKS